MGMSDVTTGDTTVDYTVASGGTDETIVIDGTPNGTQFQVNESYTSSARDCDVAPLPDGGFLGMRFSF